MFESYNEVTVTKRTRRFQQFLVHLLSVPLFKAATIVYDFLTIQDEKEFSKKKEQYTKYEKVKRIKDTKNLDGLLTSKINAAMLSNHNRIIDYNKKVVSKLNTLCEAYDTLKENFLSVSESLSKISEIHKDIYNVSKSYGDPSKITETFNSLQQLNEEWSKSYLGQISIIDTEFKDLFHIYKTDLNHFAETHDTIQEYSENYIEGYAYLKNKKEKLFTNYPVSKWEMTEEDFKITTEDVLISKEASFKLMCRKDSLEFEEKRNKFGIFCYSTMKSYQKLKTHYSRMFSECMQNLSLNNSKILADVFALVKLLHTSANKIKDLSVIQTEISVSKVAKKDSLK